MGTLAGEPDVIAPDIEARQEFAGAMAVRGAQVEAGCAGLAAVIIQ
jgi:hypothetical protein